MLVCFLYHINRHPHLNMEEELLPLGCQWSPQTIFQSSMKKAFPIHFTLVFHIDEVIWTFRLLTIIIFLLNLNLKAPPFYRKKILSSLFIQRAIGLIEISSLMTCQSLLRLMLSVSVKIIRTCEISFLFVQIFSDLAQPFGSKASAYCITISFT